MAKSHDAVLDNSLEDLVLDLWDDGAQAPPEEEPEQAELETFVEKVDQKPASTLDAPVAIRLAWSAAYSIRAVVIVVVVFIVSALVITLIMNPEMTLLDAANLYIKRIGDFVAKLGK